MDIAIIGAGASGLMCATKLSNNQKFNITVFDGNLKIGSKILITGNGRCNVTNLCEPNQFLTNVCNNSKFLMSAINLFSPYDMVEFLNEHKVKTTVEQNNRVFPVSNKASSIINMFNEILINASNVNLKLGSKVTDVLKVGTKFEVKFNGNVKTFDAVVIATGGISFPSLGCFGEGLKFAKNLGVMVTKTRPALCGIKIKENLKELEGVSFNVNLKFDSIKVAGDIMITKYGLSGPATLNLSSLILDYNINNKKLTIDFLPNITVSELTEQINNFKQNNAKKQIISMVNKFVNLKLANMILEQLGIDKQKQVSQLTKLELNNIINLLKFMELTVLGFDDIERATITRGGVDVKNVNPKTFECKTVPNLYFIGEVLDVDALSGGFNLQIAFSTGYACAQGINSKFR